MTYRSILFTAAMAFTATACGFNTTTRTPELSVTSKAREIQLGTDQARKIEELMGVVDDRELDDYVSGIGRRLADALPDKEYTYTFKVIDAETPNAFALPGGYVYVTRGLLALLNSEDELACVIGHEIAHVAARHSVRQRTRGILASPFAIATGLAGAATSIVAPRVGGLIAGVGEVTTGAVLAGYSREQEREADRIGMELASGSGWAPDGMAAMLATLGRAEKLVTGHSRETGFLDSHPAPPERAAAATAEAGKMERAASQHIAGTRRAFYERLGGLLIGANPAAGVFVEQHFIQPDLGIGLEFPPGWSLHNSRDTVGAAEPGGSAAILMQLVGRGNDPLIAADSRKNHLNFALTDVETLEINGHPAAHVIVRSAAGNTPAGMHVTWVMDGDTIYEISGVSQLDRFAEFAPVFTTTAASFGALSQAERASVHANRLTVATATGGETLHDLLDRVDSKWSPARAAVANGVQERQALEDGRAVKASVALPYPGP